MRARRVQLPRSRHEDLLGKDRSMGYNIFYIIGVVVVVALVLAWLF
jgi:hypothetical protein